jgi:hypothetical protein
MLPFVYLLEAGAEQTPISESHSDSNNAALKPCCDRHCIGVAIHLRKSTCSVDRVFRLEHVASSNTARTIVELLPSRTRLPITEHNFRQPSFPRNWSMATLAYDCKTHLGV